MTSYQRSNNEVGWWTNLHDYKLWKALPYLTLKGRKKYMGLGYLINFCKIKTNKDPPEKILKIKEQNQFKINE